MRIKRLVLTSFRGVGHAEVTFAPSGITIVEGDNEAGKTSLAEAVDLVLGVRDDSRRASVLAVQPYGQDVGPEVEIEIESGPYRFVLHKRWIKRPATTLEILEPTPISLTGREAHERVGQILDETLDRDLWEALRVRQATDPGETNFDVPALGRALDAAAGGEAGARGEDLLWDRIVAERERYWTPTGRVTVERDTLAKQLAEAEAEVREAEAELRQMDADVDEMARLIAEGHDLAARQHALDTHLAEVQERSREVAELQLELEKLTAQHAVLVAKRDAAESARTAREALVADIAASREALAAAEAELAAAEPRRLAVRQRQADATAERAAAATALVEVEERLRIASADLTHRRNEIELAQFTERLARVTEARQALAEAEPVLDDVAVTAEVVEAIEAAHIELVRAEAVAAAGAPSVVVRARAGGAISVDGAERTLAEGEQIELSVPVSSSVTVEGFEIEIRAGADAQQLGQRAAEAAAALEELCTRHGVADLAAAREAAGRRADAERTVEEARKALRDNLRDLTVEELEGKVERHTAKIAEHPRTRPAVPPMPSTFEDAKAALAAAEAEVEEARRRLTEADLRLAEAGEEATGTAAAELAQRERVNLERQRLSDLVRRLDDAQETAPDDALVAALAEAEAECQAAADRLESTQRALNRHDPATVADLLANAEQAHERGRNAIAENKTALQRLETTLEARGEQGIARRRDAALTQRERLQREHERLESRAAAAELLYQTFRTRREEAHARYVTPFKEAIERLGRVVFGPTLEVELDADLRISHRTLDGVRLAFDQLSTGAREQLGIIARLACASIVAGTDGAPVILDDTLGWTDPTRLTQMAAALGVASRDSQVIVLTCTPGRFAAVGAAATIRMGSASTRVAGDQPASA